MTTILTAMTRQRNGDKPELYWVHLRPSPDAQEQPRPIDGNTYYDLWRTYHGRASHIEDGYVAFDPDRPIELDDVMSEQR